MTDRQRIVIVGGGYAGLAAARHLADAPAAWQRVLIDPRGAHHNLPLIPDIIGHGFPAKALRYPHRVAARRWHCQAVADRIIGVDLAAGTVFGQRDRYPFDMLIMACGGDTALPGDPAWAQRICTLRSIDDAVRLRLHLRAQPQRDVVVIGGGYTGVEAATAIRRLNDHQPTTRRIAIVDHGAQLCHGLPLDLSRYVTRQVAKVGVSVHCATHIAAFDDRCLELDDGARFSNPLVLWTAGVKAPALVADIGDTIGHDGRCAVDDCLRSHERVFVAGDAARVDGPQGPLRMSVQHALAMGRCAAANASRLLRGRSPVPLQPWDPGYVVPMAQGRGAGAIFGWQRCGRIPSILHYLMATTFSYGLTNRLAVARSSARVLTTPWR